MSDELRPPCWPAGCPCPNPCAAALHDRVIYAKTPLHGPWEGWRLAGRVLVSPRRDRVTVDDLGGLLTRRALGL